MRKESPFHSILQDYGGQRQMVPSTSGCAQTPPLSGRVANAPAAMESPWDRHGTTTRHGTSTARRDGGGEDGADRTQRRRRRTRRWVKVMKPTSLTAHVIDIPPVVMEDAQPANAVLAPNYIAPTPAATYVERATVAEYTAPVPAATYAARAPVAEYFAPAPTVTHAEQPLLPNILLQHF